MTINGGLVMRAWYDIEALDRDGHVNLGHLAASVAAVRTLVGEERARGIPPERLVLAGFSQGGAVALQTAVCRTLDGAPPPEVAGVVALSAYLPLPEGVVSASSTAAPVFQAHGAWDELVPLALGIRTRDALTAAGRPVEFHSYEMGHQVSETEVHDLGVFLRRVLAPREP